jgi:hypothetical protein
MTHIRPGSQTGQNRTISARTGTAGAAFVRNIADSYSIPGHLLYRQRIGRFRRNGGQLTLVFGSLPRTNGAWFPNDFGKCLAPTR